MQMNSLGAGAGGSWLMRGIRITFGHAKPMLGTAALLLVLVIAVSLAMIVLEFVFGAVAKVPWLVTVVGFLFGTVLYPVIMGGYLRIIRRLELGQEAYPSQLLDPLLGGGGGMALIRFGLLMLLIYVVLGALVYFSFGGPVIDWYMHVMKLQASGVKPDALPAIPGGFIGAVLGMVLIFSVAKLIGALGVGQVALNGASPLEALKDAASGIFRNLLPLLVLALCMLVGALVIFAALFIVILIGVFLGKLVSVMLSVALMIITELALVMIGNAIAVAVVYAIWDDIAGGDSPQDTTETASAIEV